MEKKSGNIGCVLFVNFRKSQVKTDSIAATGCLAKRQAGEGLAGRVKRPPAGLLMSPAGLTSMAKKVVY
jgi:hypothetical protein